MNENFRSLFEASLKEIDMRPGSIITGVVTDIDKDWITVYTGLKSEGIIARSEFLDEEGHSHLGIGDEVQVALEAVEDGLGETRLSREKAKLAEAWLVLESAYQNETPIKGLIRGKVKGGFTVEIGKETNAIKAFLPGSLVDVRPVRDTSHLENKELEFKVIKLDQKRNNVVVSRRAMLEKSRGQEREELLANLHEGLEINGIVKNLTDYGAFVDLGGIDGLLHITDMAWKRIKHPSEVVTVGNEVRVKVLRFDRDRGRVSLGLKQLGQDPWIGIAARYPKDTNVKAIVTNLTDYGCFAELQEGVEGLIHVSEMDWTNKNVHPSKVVSLGQEVDVKILEVDEGRRRISLGLKQCTGNPWDDFDKKHKKGDKLKGSIKSITDFGVFIGLEGNIDGLVHLSDISWDEDGEKAVSAYKKGDDIETLILSIDPERERIALGIKQLVNDAFADYVADYDKGSLVKGVIKEVNAKSATLTLIEGVEGTLKATEFSRDATQDLRSELKEGDEIEVKIIHVDRKNRSLGLSVKAKDIADEKAAVKAHKVAGTEERSTTTIGDLIKAKMNKDKNVDDQSSDNE